GDHDYIPRVAESLGLQRLVWKVAQKPGMPLYVGQLGDKLLFGLPGNPASVLVNLIVYVRAALDALQGLQPDARWLPAQAVDGIAQFGGDAQKTLWQRVRAEICADGRLRLHRLGGQASHMLGNLAEANALLRIDPPAAGTAPVWTWL
ncbi:MAG: hypothetical protein Q8Q73_18465, partial [Stagnimonas sp.]|nr:hypothetical protein [Stagnimonas sp.]